MHSAPFLCRVLRFRIAVGISSGFDRNAMKSTKKKRLLGERPAGSHNVKEVLYIPVQWHECKSGIVEEKMK